MKYFWIFTLYTVSLFFTSKLKAQKDTLHLYQIYNTFSNEEKAEWTAFENNWNYFEYSEIKKIFKIKNLNCKNCESFYADILIAINDEGVPNIVKFLKGKKCGIICNEELFKNKFENSIQKQQFKKLKNRQFIARFGHVLKC